MNDRLYSLLIKTVPKPAVRWTAWTQWQPDPALCGRIASVLRRERAQGGVLALMDARRGITSAAFGIDRLREQIAAQPDHFFRAASISKFVTAAAALRLAEDGRIDLDRDVSDWLGFPVRHPGAPQKPITLRLLIAHRAGLRDGTAYQAALAKPQPVQALLHADSFTEHRPDEGFEYSNFGAGLVGAILEAALGQPFNDIVLSVLPLDCGGATFLPQQVRGVLADAWRLMPPSRMPNYDAAARQAQPLREMDVRLDYLTAHGGLCVTASGLLKLAQWTLETPACRTMRVPLSSFGRRDPCLREGLGCFIYQDSALPFPLYGHQGLAYGAVHGLFFREETPPEGIYGFAFLSSAVSEQRSGVITAVNRDIARAIWKA